MMSQFINEKFRDEVSLLQRFNQEQHMMFLLISACSTQRKGKETYWCTCCRSKLSSACVLGTSIGRSKVTSASSLLHWDLFGFGLVHFGLVWPSTICLGAICLSSVKLSSASFRTARNLQEQSNLSSASVRTDRHLQGQSSFSSASE